MPEPLLAVDLGPIIGLVFLVISFVSWILNTVQNANKGKAQPPAGANRGRQPNKRVKSEIELFLEEVTGNKQAPQKQQRQRPKQQQRPRQPQRQGQRQRRPQRSQQRPKDKRQQVGQSGPSRPPLSEKAERKSTFSESSSTLGSSLREHVDEYMSDQQLGQGVDEAVEAHIDRHVEEHLGSIDESLERGDQPSTAEGMLQMLRTPNGMRQAILASEILNRPRRS